MLNDLIHKKVSSSIFFYNIYYYLVRSRRGGKINLPNKNDDLYIDGFPRSGNTFLVGMVNDVFKYELELNSHHLHVISGIKLAKRLKLKTFILIRDPSDSVTSFLIMQRYYNKGDYKNLKFINTILKQYLNYYEYVFKHKNEIELVLFEHLVKDPISCLYRVNELFSLEISTKEVSDRYLKFNSEFQNNQLKKPIERTSLPNQERNLLKNEIKKEVKKSKYYASAEEVYQELIKINNN